MPKVKTTPEISFNNKLDPDKVTTQPQFTIPNIRIPQQTAEDGGNLGPKASLQQISKKDVPEIPQFQQDFVRQSLDDLPKILERKRKEKLTPITPSFFKINKEKSKLREPREEKRYRQKPPYTIDELIDIHRQMCREDLDEEDKYEKDMAKRTKHLIEHKKPKKSIAKMLGTDLQSELKKDVSVSKSSRHRHEGAIKQKEWENKQKQEREEAERQREQRLLKDLVTISEFAQKVGIVRQEEMSLEDFHLVVLNHITQAVSPYFLKLLGNIRIFHEDSNRATKWLIKYNLKTLFKIKQQIKEAQDSNKTDSLQQLESEKEETEMKLADNVSGFSFQHGGYHPEFRVRFRMFLKANLPIALMTYQWGDIVGKYCDSSEIYDIKSLKNPEDQFNAYVRKLIVKLLDFTTSGEYTENEQGKMEYDPTVIKIKKPGDSISELDKELFRMEYENPVRALEFRKLLEKHPKIGVLARKWEIKPEEGETTEDFRNWILENETEIKRIFPDYTASNDTGFKKRFIQYFNMYGNLDNITFYLRKGEVQTLYIPEFGNLRTTPEQKKEEDEFRRQEAENIRKEKKEKREKERALRALIRLTKSGGYSMKKAEHALSEYDYSQWPRVVSRLIREQNS